MPIVRVLLDSVPTYQRFVALGIGLFLVTGCGDKGLDKPLPAVTKSLKVTLPWTDGARIPQPYTCDGIDRKPFVQVAGAQGHPIAVVMTDPDAPNGTFVHWTRWDHTEGENSFGKTGYDGPCPPKGDEPHHYVVTAYALRAPLDLESGAKPGDVVEAIKEQAVESGSSTGLYGR
jgi:phosphatidylethanolamine-binding protein (PEBP) family uncharacterized protein